MSNHGSLVVIGSGPGIGRATAALFAEKGFNHIILLSRNKQRLAEDADIVGKASPSAKVETQELDLAADESSIKKTLAEVDVKLKAAGTQLEVVLYNGARVAPSKVLEWEAKELETDLRVTTVSLYITLQWAIPHLQAASEFSSSSLNPAFLVTSGGLYRNPVHFLFSLSASKAAQHNLVASFHQAFEPQIHIAAIPVIGFVSDEAKVTTPRAVAEEFWRCYSVPKGTEGEVSVEMEDPDYEEGVEGMRKAILGE